LDMDKRVTGKAPKLDPMEFKGIDPDSLRKRGRETEPLSEEEFGLEALVPDYLEKRTILLRKKERIIREGAASKEKLLLLKAMLEDRKAEESAEILTAAQLKLEQKLGEKLRLVGEAVKKKKPKKPKTSEQKLTEKIKKKFSEKRKKLKSRAKKEENFDLSKELRVLKEEETKVLLTEKNKALLSQDFQIKRKK